MKRGRLFSLALLMSLALFLSPAILEARGHGGGGHGGHGSHGGHGGRHHGGFHGAHGHGGRSFGVAPFFGFGAGFLTGYWLNGYYYTYPYNGLCQRWVPTGSYHIEMRQDPSTGIWNAVQVPDGYWETFLCY